MKFLKKYAPLIILTLFIVFAQALCEVILPSFTQAIVDVGIKNSDMSVIYSSAMKMLGVTLISVSFTIVSSYFASKISVGFARDLREGVFKKVLTFSKFTNFTTSSLITRTTNDINQVQQLTFYALRLVVISPLMAIGGIIMAIRTDVGLAPVLYVALPALGVCIGIAFSKAVPIYTSLQKKIDRLTTVMREELTGIRVVRAFNKDTAPKFDSVNKELSDTEFRSIRIVATLMPSIMLVLNFSSLAIVWIGAHRIDANLTEVGSIMAFLQYSNLILMSFVILSMILTMIPRAMASMKRINEVLGTEPNVCDGDITHIDKINSIEFKNVSFGFPGSSENTLTDINFKAKTGDTVAIIGSTGCGKSTIVNLLVRFLDVTKGEILINDIDIRKFNLKTLRDKMAYCPQKSLLFSGTIKSNIGLSGADMHTIISSAELACASDFINEKSDKYDEHIAQGGKNVSGGQRQRLSIARAIAKNAPVYVFDDSFSALDFKTDKIVRENLKNHIKDGIVFIVAQRISTVLTADNILVVDNGHIVGQGTHTELMKTCSVYKEIALSQLSEKELKEVL